MDTKKLFGKVLTGIRQTAVIFMCMMLGASFIQAGTATVDANTKYQTIRGFGAASVWIGGKITAALADKFWLDDTVNGHVGFTMLRTRIVPTGDGTQAAETNPMTLALARNANMLIFSTAWTPPTAYKDNGNIVAGNFNATPANQTAYATWLVNYVKAVKSQKGVTLYAVSPQNEPDLQTSYESCAWTAAQFQVFIRDYMGPAFKSAGLTTKILMPEHSKDNLSMSAAAMGDAACAAYIDIIGGHIYGGGPNTLPASYGNKEHWQTEYSDYAAYDGSINSGITYSLSVHKCLVNANFNAYVFWWLINNNTDNEGLCDSSGIPAKRLYTMGNYSKFVRPGYVRIASTVNPSTNVTTSAYLGASAGKFVIVVTNQNSSAQSTTFNLTGISTSSVVPWITDASNDLVQLSAVSVSGNSFTYSMPASSVVSFVGSTGVVVSTPMVTATRTAIPSSTRTMTVTLTRTNTAVPPTATRTNTPTATSTATRTNTAISPTATRTATSTAVPPTSTSSVVPTATLTRINTAVQPTSTSSVVPTATSTRTNTAVPPTATSTAVNTAVPPTATSTAVNTAVPPTATSTAVNTAVPPTATSTAVNTAVPPTATSTAVNTAVPPTATSTAVNTAVPPTSTSTAVPPTKISTRTNTAVPTATRTIILPPPTITSTSGPVITSITIKLMEADNNNSTNSPHPQFLIMNTGTQAINLNNVEARYWFNCDCTGQAVQVWVDWAGMTLSGVAITTNVQASVVATTLGNQSNYLSIKFTGDQTLEPGQSLEVKTRFNKTDWSPMLQSNDWSYINTTTYTDWNKVTGYINERLVYGQEPAAAQNMLTVSGVLTYPNPAAAGAGATIKYTLAAPSVSPSGDGKDTFISTPDTSVVLSIFTVSGRLIWRKKVEGPANVSTGEHALYWDGKAGGSLPLAKGIYTLQVEIKSAGISNKAYSRIVMLN